MNKRKRLSYWRNYHRRSLSYENSFTPKIQRELLLQLKAVINSLKSHNIEHTSTSLDSLISGEGIRTVLISMWYSIFPKTARTVIQQLDEQYGEELRRKFFDTPNAYWLQIINEYILSSVPGQVSEITDFTKEWIRRKLRQGIEQQMSIDEIVQLLIEKDISASRARVIARTNITGIMNAAGKAAAKETKILLRKMWISAQDNRTRRIPRDRYDHVHMDGVAVNIDEKFNVNGDLIDFPGDPHGQAANIIQCRCTTAYEAVRDTQGRIIRNEYTTVIKPRQGGQQQIITI
jgi:hypothetical protein